MCLPLSAVIEGQKSIFSNRLWFIIVQIQKARINPRRLTGATHEVDHLPHGVVFMLVGSCLVCLYRAERLHRNAIKIL